MRKTRLPKQCEMCKTIFEPSTALVRQGYGKFCNIKCYGKWLSLNCDKSKMREIGGKRKNRICTIVTKNKISMKNRGRKRPDITGEKCHLWKGGVNTENMKQRRSSDYLNWRKSVFERDNYTCIECEEKSGNGKAVYLEADHIKPFSQFPKLRLDINNGRTLCRDCHKKIGFCGRPKKIS